MSTVSEIIEAVKQLRPEEKRDLLLRLEPVLLGSDAARTEEANADYLSADFTRRLAEHLHKAKRAALREG